MAPDKRKRQKRVIASWILASRPATLVISLSSVALAYSAALLTVAGRKASWVMIFLVALTALFLQLGANYINDYGDGIRGTDDNRSSHAPSRLIASGFHPFSVLTAGLSFLILATGPGVISVILTQRWQLLIVGALSIAGAYLYTAGPFPYAYFGLGELFVFLFFGPVTVLGTVFLMSGIITVSSILIGVAAGAWASAILLMNNLRDLEGDEQSGKRTISVVFGLLPSRIICITLLAIPYIVTLILLFDISSLGYAFLTLLLSVPVGIIIATGITPKEFAIAFRLSIICMIAFSVFFVWGMAT